MKCALFLFALALAAPFVVAQAPPPPPPREPQAQGLGQTDAPARRTPGGTQAGNLPDAPKGSVRGFVYAQDTGAPLKRAQVMMRQERRPGEPLSTVTDAQGSFEFRNVEPGTYSISANRSGFVSGGYGQTGPNRPPTPLTVSPGQEVKDVAVRLIRGGVITGAVMDEDGEPLANVQVQVLTRQYIRGQARTMPRGGGSTDDRGVYRVFNLPPGRYYVQAVNRSFGPEQRSPMYAPIYYPNALSLQDAQRVEVTPGGEVQRIDMRLRPVQTFAISGRVVDPEGQPVGGAQISAGPADQFAGMMFRAARPDGTFRLEGLLPGRNRITVMVRGQMASQPTGPPPNVTRFIDVGNSDMENVVLVVGPGLTLRGRVVAEAGASLQNPERSRVMLMPKGDIMMGMGSVSATLAADLTFELKNVQPGEYTLNFFGSSMGNVGGPAASSFYVGEVRIGGQNLIDRGITVPESGAIGPIDVILNFDAGSVSGRVTNAAGEPISGVQVVLVAADREKRALERYFRQGAPDQSGNYTIRGVVPGDYLVLVWPDSDSGRVLDPDLFVQLERHATSVTVGRSATATKDLKLTDEVRALAASVAQ